MTPTHPRSMHPSHGLSLLCLILLGMTSALALIAAGWR